MMRAKSVAHNQVLVLALSVFAVSSAAVLIRWADASALSLSFWRTAGGAVVLIPIAGSSLRQVQRRHAAPILLAGLSLAAHFWLWLASLTMTSVAASTTLVSTVPLFVAFFIAASTRKRINGRTWLAIVAAIAGSAIIAGGDIGLQGDELAGDVLAVGGAAAMAVYLLAGEHVRADLSAAAYSSATYAVAAVALGLAAALTKTPLVGFDRTTWVVIAALILGPQLLGHTLLNHLLAQLGSLPVSMALLLEPIGAGLLAWAFLGEAPTIAVWLGAPLVLAGVATQLTTSTSSAH